MIATRRLGRARHEFRFGTRELLVLGAVFCLIAGLVFAGGILVGREMARKGTARAESARMLGRTDLDGAAGEPPGKTAATRTEEKVTFYRTLTAPTPDLPQVAKPTIEERLVPKDEPASPVSAPLAPSIAPPAVPSAASSAAPSGALPAAPPVATPVTADEAPDPAPLTPGRPAPKTPDLARTLRPARTPKVPAVRPAPAQLAAAPAPAEPEAWTVQVSAFRSRALAEELRSRLVARGFDAYVFPSITEDGRPRYRVRVGAYPSRGEAERAAGELRSERGLNPLVTPRVR